MKENIKTLKNEISEFANELPYWSKHLAEKILAGKLISDADINNSFSYLLEELRLTDKTEKPEITISYNAGNLDNYKTDLKFLKLENVEGVNALTEN